MNSRKLTSLALGTVFTFLLLEGLLSVAYRGFVLYQERANRQVALGGEGEVRILCIGESTTAVAGDETGRLLVPTTSYPTQLERLLNERQSAVTFRVINSGMMGGTTSAVIEMLEPAIQRYDPQLIIAMMGIKDTSDQQLPGSAWLPGWMRSLRTVQLSAWAVEAIRLRRNAVLTDVESVDDLPEALRPDFNQLAKYVKETKMIGPGAQVGATGDLQVATYLWFIGRHDEAAEKLGKVIGTYGVGYNLLARVLATGGRMSEAEQVLEQAMRYDPAEGMYRVTLADLLTEQGRYDEAQAILDVAWQMRASFRQPALVEAYIQLTMATVAEERGRAWEAIEILDQVNPFPEGQRDAKGFFPRVQMLRSTVLGMSYAKLGDYAAAEENYLIALDASPGNHATMWLLSQVYRGSGDYAKEEELRRQLLSKTGRMAEYFEMAKLFRLYGAEDRIPELFDEAVARIPSLSANYGTLYETSERHGIQLVVMQYPGFSVELLHKYAPPREGVVFIDNEHVFDANPDGLFFEPRFPNSFSHYTQRGAVVLAEHVADEILAVYGEEPTRSHAATGGP